MKANDTLASGICEGRTGHGVLVRHAAPADTDAIVTLIDQWADEGLTLRRDHEDVLVHIGSFVVGVTDTVVACAALDRVGPGLGEIRSVAVSTSARGMGAGRVVVERLVEVASIAGVRRIVLLTKTPGFFERVGFEGVDEAALPEAYLESLAARGRTTHLRTPMSRLIVPAAEPSAPDASVGAV